MGETRPSDQIRVPPPNWYLRWRAEKFNLLRFSEKPDQAPPESLLQQVWLYQRLSPEKLQTADGRRVRIFHPGFWNKEAGPDFRHALIQVGEEAPVHGDIELDVLPAGWEQHFHAQNPAYENVVLHVTWEPESGRAMPSIALKHALDSPLSELSFWLGVQPKPLPDGLAGQCAAPLKGLPYGELREIFRQAAQARLRRKAEQIQARARQVGREGALWEGLFAALGYKRNVWPMRRIAELRGVICAEVPAPDTRLYLQARLFGLAGFLPAERPRAGDSDQYIRTLWQIWWRESAQFREYVLPAKLWNLGGTRPPNHPQRRLALAAHWLSSPDLPERLGRWADRSIEGPDLVPSLGQILEPAGDAFWDYRYTFRSAPVRRPQQLLGEQRVSDLAMNVVLPWLYVRACAGAHERLAAATEARYLLWPPSEDNSVLRLARSRLFGGAPANFLKTAADQQAVLQIVRDFCDHSNSVCQNCLFPELLQSVPRAK